MKQSEIKGLSLDELKNKLAVEKENYNRLKFAHAITPIENPMKIRETRRLIARMETEVRAKELSK
jgi:large subunit ribosomal protein L29